MHKLVCALIGLATLAGTNSSFGQNGPNDLRNRLLEKYDKDGDGKLNVAERNAARAAFLKHPRPSLPDFDNTDDARKQRLIEGDIRRKLLQWYDKDGNGKLNAAEKVAAQTELLNLLASVSEPEFQPRTPTEAELKRRERARQQLLTAWDKDGDGEFSEAEQAAMREDLEKKREAARARIMKEFDTNGDGEIDESERDSLRASYEKQREEIARKYDKDGSGGLSVEEREAMIDDLRKQQGQITEKYDKNGNGYLEFEEEEEKARADGAFEGSESPFPFGILTGVRGSAFSPPERGRPRPPRSARDRRPQRPAGS